MQSSESSSFRIKRTWQHYQVALNSFAMAAFSPSDSMPDERPKEHRPERSGFSRSDIDPQDLATPFGIEADGREPEIGRSLKGVTRS